MSSKVKSPKPPVIYTIAPKVLFPKSEVNITAIFAISSGKVNLPSGLSI